MNLLEMSIWVSVMILIVLLVRIFGKKYISKTVIISLWNLVLARALVPFQIPMGNIPIFKQRDSRLAVPPIEFTEYYMEQVFVSGLEKNGGLSRYWQIENYLPMLWLAGVLCLFLYFARIYVEEYRLLKKCTPIQNGTAERLIRNVSLRRKVRLYEGSSFIAPVTYGVLRPKIVIPENLDDVSRVDMRNMIAHELVHIQRYDVAKRFFMLTAFCIHWFNPLIWVMYHCYRIDQEIACDERVLRDMAGEEAKNYVYTMIKMASGGRMLWSTTGFVGKSAERKRILAAMNQKRMGRGSILAAVVLSLCLILPFLSFAQVEEAVDTQAFQIQGQIEESWPESLKPVKKEQVLLAPLYEGEMESLGTENFDYKAVLKDIEENYNDLSQELTDEQDAAVMIQTNIFLAEVLKRLQDSGEKLNAKEQWLVDEYYHYDEKHPITN